MKTLNDIIKQASKEIFKFKYSKQITPITKLASIGKSKTPALVKLSKVKPDAYVSLVGSMPVLNYKV